MNSPVDILLKFIHKFDSGKVFIPYGSHVYKIHTKGHPVNIWLTELNVDGIPVCHGTINLYGTTIVHDGFVLYAQVNADTVELEWQAVVEIQE